MAPEPLKAPARPVRCSAAVLVKPQGGNDNALSIAPAKTTSALPHEVGSRSCERTSEGVGINNTRRSASKSSAIRRRRRVDVYNLARESSQPDDMVCQLAWLAR